MKTSDLSEKLGFKTASAFENGDITGAYTSDLLSDVMGNAPADSVLITIQAHKNTVAVASLAGIKAIVLCNNRVPTPDMVAAAEDEDIALFVSDKDQFTVSCKVGSLLSPIP